MHKNKIMKLCNQISLLRICVLHKSTINTSINIVYILRVKKRMNCQQCRIKYDMQIFTT
jgi:hypothetical protein